MALIQVSYGLINDKEVFDLVVKSFDSIEEVRDEPQYKRKVFRVQHKEITKDDKLICPDMIELPGITPFIISFD